MPKTNNKALLTIFLIVFIDLLGFGIIIPLLPYIAENFSASPFQIGIMVASYSLFQFISSPILGKLSDRYGRKKLLFISQIGSSLGFILLGLANSLPLLFLARIIDGITGGNISIAQAYIADVTDKKTRAKGMGMLGAAFGLGFMLGPVIGGTLSQISFSAPAYFAAGIAALAALATSLFLKETVNIRKTKNSPHTKFNLQEIKEVLKLQPLGLLIISFFLLSFGFSGIQGTYALWVERTFNWGPKEVGYIFAFIGAVSITTQLLIVPRAVKRFGERKTLKNAIPITGLGFLTFLFAKNIPTLILANFLIVFGNSLSNPTIQAIASESVKKEEYGSTLGLLQSSGSLGRIGGPIIAGKLFESVGKDSPFAVSGTLILLTALLVQKNIEDKESLTTKVKRILH